MGEACGAAEAAEDRPTILIVEDEVLIRLMMADELIQAGYRVVQCATADEAWVVLQSSLGVGVVITDIRMPGSMNGIELAKRIRSNWPPIKIVIGSGDVLKEPVADAYLGKPYAPQELVGCVKRLLAKKNAQP